MADSPTFHTDLVSLLPPIPADSIISRSVPAGPGVRATLFGFALGQELTEHTASRPAILHFLQGRARLTLGGEEKQARPGAWAYLPANLPHSIYAEEPVVMLLLLLD
ncbi:MAG TPA: cupin domain-containing protein [Anaerolineales bacterium]|nr:cupin domain-containing protein [Anaerolineales bacterium]